MFREEHQTDTRVAPGKKALKEGSDFTSSNRPPVKDLAPSKDEGGLDGRF